MIIRIFFIIFIFFLVSKISLDPIKYPLSAFTPYAHSQTIPQDGVYTVERVISGDTLKLPNGEMVRLIGVDVPESPNDAERIGQGLEIIEANQKEAKAYLTRYINRLPNHEVYLEFDAEKKDKYSKSGRLLAYVFCDAGPLNAGGNDVQVGAHQYFDHFNGKYMHFINATMVKAGYATPMAVPPNIKYAELFEKLYREAREQKRGLWIGQKPAKEQKEFYPDGALKLHMGIYNEENSEGFWKEYHDNGALKTDVKLLKIDDGCSNEVGIPIEGIAREYHKNGQLKSVGWYKNNCEEGAHNYYSEDGLLEQKLYYERGRHMWTKRFNQDGKIYSEEYYEKD